MNKFKSDGEEKKRLFEHVTPIGGDKPQLFEHVTPIGGDKPQLFEHVTPIGGDKPQLFEHVTEKSGEKKHLFTHITPKNENNVQCIQREDICTTYMKEVLTTEKMVKEDSVKAAVTEENDWKNFELELREIINKIYDTPNGEGREVLYQFVIHIGAMKFDATVNAEYVGNFKWVSKASEGRAFIRKGQKGIGFEEFIGDLINSSTPKIRYNFNLNGWKKIDGRAVYVYDSGTVGNVLPNVSGNQKYKFEFDAEKVGKRETFIQTLEMLEICSDKKITLPLFLFTHMGALTTLFEEAGYPIKFVLSLIGKTNSRKTSLSLCMTKTLNRREISKPAVNFNATECGIEKMIGLHADAVLTIDDFMPASAKGKQRILDTKLEKVLRMYGDREGVERMTDFAKNPGAGYYPVRGVGVITGEHFRGVQSSILRSLILEIQQDSVDNEKLLFYQKNFKILNTHLYGFLHYITTKCEGVIQFIRQNMEKYRAQKIFEMPRYGEMYAQLRTTIEITLEYARDCGYINFCMSQEISEEWDEILRQVIKKNAMEIKQHDWPTILREILVSIVEDGTSQLPKNEEKDYGSEVFEDERFIYIRLDVFLKRMQSLLEIWKIDMPVLSKTGILNKLEEADLIETMNKPEGKRTLRLPGSKRNRQRFLFIKKSKLEIPVIDRENLQ